MKREKIAIIGLGYVGLPLALAFAKKFPNTTGFDINKEKVAAIKRGEDVISEGISDEIKATTLKITSNPEDLKEITFFIVGVPTPVDENNNPDLRPLISASEIIGKIIQKGAIVCFESTVYPGVTEDICGAKIAETSGLIAGIDFKLAYSPERINPGDKEHTLEKITKVVSGQDSETLEKVAQIYAFVVHAGIHKAPSIKVAEAAKVIENTQRDLNIALMNELSIIFDRLGIRTKDVLDAAGTKWNFMRFTPGLVGGHCIGVDPYYLTTKAEQLGYHPQVILAGRRINDDMGKFVAQKLVKLLVHAEKPIKSSRVGILGITFKENVTDLRNSRVPDIIKELGEFGVTTLIHDPLVSKADALHEYNLKLADFSELKDLDALIFAVPHKEFLKINPQELFSLIQKPGVFVDLKSVFSPNEMPEGIGYWSL